MNLKIIPAAICLLGLLFGCEKKPAVTVRATDHEEKKIFSLQTQSPISYTAPENWTLDTAPSDTRLATFKIGQSTTLIASRFEASSFSDELGNINRWRQQIGLPPVESVSDQPAQEVEIGEFKARLYDLSNPSDKRMLVAVLIKNPSVWYFKLEGPADEAASAIPDLKSFLQSVRFN
jgi:hypothetical protein